MRLAWKRPNVSSSRALQPNLLLAVLRVKAPQQALMAGEAAATAADKPMWAYPALPVPKVPRVALPTWALLTGSLRLLLILKRRKRRSPLLSVLPVMNLSVLQKLQMPETT
jgi:hypothetical protein